jgi:hypothetical protein
MSKTVAIQTAETDQTDLSVEMTGAELALLGGVQTKSTGLNLPTFEGTVSPYGAMKKVNAFLKSIGVEKELPGPMFYTYRNKKYIKSDEQGNISWTNLNAWFQKYAEKNSKNW